MNRIWRLISSGLAVLVIGLLTTAAVSWAAWSAHEDNERRLTRQRTREAGAVLEASIPGVEAPLATAANLIVEQVAPVDAVFTQTLGTQAGPKELYASVALWPIGRTEPLLTAGVAPKLLGQAPTLVERVLDAAADADGIQVVGLLEGDDPRLGYGYGYQAASGERFVLYAEQVLPADRTSAVQQDSAFAGLDYALYLGEESSDGLVFASTPELPLVGRRASEPIPFGDTELVLVMSPTGELGGALLARLPGLLLAGGLAFTAVGTWLIAMLRLRRQTAQELAEENARLLAEQRAMSDDLQASLLPGRLPDIDGLELKARYTAGVAGTSVGGDWYDVVRLGDHRTALIIGDVSGRGLAAASVMTAVRHAVRALISEGHPPEVALTRVAAFDTEERRGHFATVLCCVIDTDAATLTYATAGHPPPLLLEGSSADYVMAPVGPPIGAAVGVPVYRPVTASIRPGCTILLMTDGLFERRGEPIDDGLERLRVAALGAPTELDSFLDSLGTAMFDANAGDDAAILAVRWT